MTFTTRPEIKGTFGVVTTTHWLASAVGMKLLEEGGNAFDAAVAAGLVLSVVEPHLNGPLGDLPILAWRAGEEVPQVICAQGVAPAGLTIAHCRREGLDHIPGAGLLATVVPGAFDGWMQLLRDWGTRPLRDVLAPALHYAEAGHPLLPRVAATIEGQAAFFRAEWPSSAATWLPRDEAPAPWSLFRNPDLAATWRRLLAEAEGARGREAGIQAARTAFYRGFVAETIGDWLAGAELADATGTRRRGVLSADDMAAWSATVEPAVAGGYRDWTLWKTGPWGQGPALLQALGILEAVGLDGVDLEGPDFVHLVIEALKLALADREAFYGDPEGAEIPLAALLSRDHGAERAALIGQRASREQRPSVLPGYEAWAEAAVGRAARVAAAAGPGAGEPTMAHLARRPGDTVHLDVIDRWGNMVSATPSGGWLQSSPVVPGLGMALNTRAQMFWLEEGLASSLAPGRRPRTTLSPSMARGPDGTRLAFGTPGGDQQDQWQLVFFLRHVHGMRDLQRAIDAPLFHTQHMQSSFDPRVARPGHLMVEPGLGEATIGALTARGHEVEVAAPWSVGRLTAAARDPDGLLRAAATPRLMQAYATGR
ncbi:MAG: gamma-glutamyltransferase family protein [Pseudomonadota bacterium]